MALARVPCQGQRARSAGAARCGDHRQTPWHFETAVTTVRAVSTAQTKQGKMPSYSEATSQVGQY